MAPRYAGTTRYRRFDDLDQASHKGRLAKLAGYDGQRPLGCKHTRDLTRGQLGIEEVHGVRYHHQIKAVIVEGQGLGGGVNRAQREPTPAGLGLEPV